MYSCKFAVNNVAGVHMDVCDLIVHIIVFDFVIHIIWCTYVLGVILHNISISTKQNIMLLDSSLKLYKIIDIFDNFEYLLLVNLDCAS